ncbi:hypothetical protein Megpolyxen_01901 (plasmid) [Candidatus Megaera polyxenophila]|nr:hypothetical protein Megpolyxen_01901 [Candidatus Megaera polyxenophila]
MKGISVWITLTFLIQKQRKIFAIEFAYAHKIIFLNLSGWQERIFRKRFKLKSSGLSFMKSFLLYF